jgi:hypothetical protein
MAFKKLKHIAIYFNSLQEVETAIVAIGETMRLSTSLTERSTFIFMLNFLSITWRVEIQQSSV